MSTAGPSGQCGILSRVVLMRSDHPGWTGLRTMLRGYPGALVVAETDEPGEMVSLVLTHRPDVVLLAAEHVSSETVPLLDELRTHQRCKLVVVGELCQPRHLVALAQSGLAAHIRWADCRLEYLTRVLGLLHDRDVMIVSRAAVEQLFTQVDGERFGQCAEAALSDREHTVLRRLADGLDLQAIADCEHVSLRTVKRSLVGLEEKFRAPNRLVMAVRAALLGYLR